ELASTDARFCSICGVPLGGAAGASRPSGGASGASGEDGTVRASDMAGPASRREWKPEAAAGRAFDGGAAGAALDARSAQPYTGG
ncbi:MAG: hypothetical protein LC708_01725, partial [Actinobacteria bacterium]|nr:hypothetical protein [Actinomycetota bacterium]